MILEKIFMNKQSSNSNYSKQDYENMDLTQLLDMRYDKETPVDELHKIIRVLRKKYPAGTTSVRGWTK